jgi:hypothetical protein
LGTWARVKVHRDCHVQFEQSLYSVPFTLIGRTLWLRATDVSVSVYEEYGLIAQHLRARVSGTRRTVRAHLPPEAQKFFLHDRHWCEAQAQKIGEACRELVTHLLADRIVERLRAAQGIVRLADTYGAERLDRACRRALDHGSPYYRTVKTLLASRPALLDQPTGIDGRVLYLTEARFARSARSLFPAADGGAVTTVTQGDLQ